jgi:hypothetical protein
MRGSRTASLVVVWLLVVAPAAWAQSGITGVVRDASGGLLPGVTVEASSPALIEKIRVAVTNGQGIYRIVDLRPGLYTVTFSLPGFTTLRRDGVQLPAEFTATVDAQLSVGALEETITVTGEAPLVDMRSTRGQVQFEQETLESMPGTGRLALLQQVIPGAGLLRATDRSVGQLSDRASTNWSLHGAPASRPVVDGMNYQLAQLNQGVFVYNQVGFQEVVVETSGVGADRDTGGLQLNMIPKEGSNLFAGSASYAYLGPSLESSNASDELLARGLNPDRLGSLKKWRDTSGSLGGRIVRDHLWFFGAFREGVNQAYSDFMYFNSVKQPESFLYVPDLSRPAYTDDYTKDFTLRLTWQAAERHKVTASMMHQPNCNCFFNLIADPADPLAAGDHKYNPNYISAATWTFPVSSRVLFEARGSAQIHKQNDTRTTGLGQKLTDIEITEQSPGFTYGAVGRTRHLPRQQYQGAFTVSYVTGSHNFKTGLQLRHMTRGNIDELGNDIFQAGAYAMTYRFREGVPNRVTLLDAPWNYEESVRDIAFYAQDQWTIDRLTLNLGLRFNDAVGSTPEQVLGAGIWVPERRFAPLTNVPHWTNLSPRVGAAYDLFGDGRTAVKFSLGRYPVQTEQAASNPARSRTASVFMTWNDQNRNYWPDCELTNPAANGECGRWSNLNFGQPTVSTRYADDATTGFNQDSHHFEGAVSVQHELTRGVGLNVGYYRTWYGGFLAMENLATGAADYDEFCITAPTDARLGSRSGREVCGLYDVRPTLFGQIDNLISEATNYGTQRHIYNGVDATMTARFGQGGFLSGGLSVGRTVYDLCAFNDLPNVTSDFYVFPGNAGSSTRIPFQAFDVLPRTSEYCKIEPTWGSGTQVKFMGVYPLPYDIQTSVIYQNTPGVPIRASYLATNDEIRPSLGRNLAAGTSANVAVDIIPYGTMHEPRGHQIDLRFSKIVRLRGTARLRGNFDIFNAFNANDVLQTVPRYGSQWLDVQQILSGRLLKFSVAFDF